jgi:uncharacterized protein (DUF1501 family)
MVGMNGFDGLSRREMLAGGAAGVAGALLPAPAQRGDEHGLLLRTGVAESVILLNLVGGPSQLETFDPKPEAPSEVRGPYGAMRTKVAGIQMSELLPWTARQADKLAILRAVHHDAAPVHETGMRLWQTGNVADGDNARPHVGALLSQARPARSGMPGWVVLPGLVGNVGGCGSTGQTAGELGESYRPMVLDDLAADRAWSEAVDFRREPEALHKAYGDSRFGRCCLMARRLVERGVRCVTVNMFTSLADGPTWDAHGGRVRGGVAACAEHVVPVFDRAFATLLADLDARGLLARTLVVAAGEMGRSPRMNRRGGRDHWTRCWSVAMAGAGVRGGQVIGASDRFGAEPVEGAVHAGRLFRMIRQALFAHGMSHV